MQVPVVVSGTNKKGNPVNRQTFSPADLLGVGQILASDALSEAQQIDRVKSYALKELGLQTQNGRTVLMDMTETENGKLARLPPVLTQTVHRQQRQRCVNRLRESR